MASMRTLENLFSTSRASRARANGGTTAPGHSMSERNGRVDDWAELRLEIARSRRFARSFGLVRIQGIPRQNLNTALRSIDRSWTVNGITYVLLPEADRDAAQSVRGRLLREASELLAGCSLSVAAFPEDGLTTGALLKALRPPSERARELEGRPAFAPLVDPPALHA